MGYEEFPTFNDLVKNATGGAKEEVWAPRVEYEVIGAYLSMGDSFPRWLERRPVVGEKMESKAGKILEIKSIVHMYNGAIRIVLGRDLGGSHAESGAGGSLSE
jgi:hypothetical protein